MVPTSRGQILAPADPSPAELLCRNGRVSAIGNVNLENINLLGQSPLGGSVAFLLKHVPAQSQRVFRLCRENGSSWRTTNQKIQRRRIFGFVPAGKCQRAMLPFSPLISIIAQRPCEAQLIIRMILTRAMIRWTIKPDLNDNNVQTGDCLSEHKMSFGSAGPNLEDRRTAATG
jgi:hypothetical protein